MNLRQRASSCLLVTLAFYYNVRLDSKAFLLHRNAKRDSHGLVDLNINHGFSFFY